MEEKNAYIMQEILEAFYSVALELRHGIIDEATARERLLKIAERYDRNIGREASDKQPGLFR